MMHAHSHQSFDLCHPHIFDGIIHAASRDTRLRLRLVSRNARDRVDYWYPGHIIFTYGDLYLTARTPIAPLASDAATSSPDVTRTLLHVGEKVTKPNHDPQQNREFIKAALAEMKETVSIAGVLDLDAARESTIWLYNTHLKSILKNMVVLHTVRYINQLDPRQFLLPARRVVFFIELPHAWAAERHLFDLLPAGIKRLVVNIHGTSPLDVPKAQCHRTDWHFCLYKPAPPTQLGLIQLPEEIVFMLSFTATSDDPDDPLLFLRTLCNLVIVLLVLRFPWGKPRFVFVFTEANLAPFGSDTVKENDMTEADGETSKNITGTTKANAETTKASTDAKMNTEATETNTGDTFKSTHMQKQYDDHMRDRKQRFKKYIIARTTRAISDARPIPGLPSQFFPEWSNDAIEALDGRIEVLTDKEYRQRVGEYSFRLETVPFTSHN